MIPDLFLCALFIAFSAYVILLFRAWRKERAKVDALTDLNGRLLENMSDVYRLLTQLTQPTEVAVNRESWLVQRRGNA